MKEFVDGVVDFLVSEKFYGPIIAILGGFLIYSLFKSVIFKVKTRRGKRKNHKKEDTVLNLIKNIVKYVIMSIVLLIILEIYGVNTTSIIASLSVVGVVVGLAFKNMLSGIIIIFDNRYNVGDVVDINGFIGEVVSLGLQTTKLQAYTGEMFTILNSSINTVINYTEADTRLVLDLGVSYSTDLSLLEKALNKIKPKVEKIENVSGPLELLGVDSLGSNQVVYRVAVLCKPYTHFGVKREALKIIKNEFDKANIEIPFTQVDVHIKEEPKKKTKK